jgi:hypothetical protein
MTSSNGRAHTVLSVVVAYSLWLASAALSLWLVLQARLLFLIDLPLRSRNINHWAFSAIDKLGFFILGAIWVVFLVVSEEVFRRLISRKVSYRTILRVFIVEGVLLAIVYLWRYLL